MALSESTPRTGIQFLNGGIVIAMLAEESNEFFRGAAVGLDAGDQFAQPLEDGDVFMGICLENKVIGSAGGVERIDVQIGGAFELPLAAVATADIAKAVFATDDGTYTLTETANSSVGRIIDVPVTGTCIVLLKKPGEALAAAQTAVASVT